MPMIVVPDDEPPVLAGTEQEKRLRSVGEVCVFGSRALSEEELVSRLGDAEVVLNIRSTSRFTRGVMRACPKLKAVSIYGVGYDNVDVGAAQEQGITVMNTPGYSAVAVAELAVSLMLAVARRVVSHDRSVRQGGWARGYGTQLHGKMLGVLGAGSIGGRMIEVGKALGMHVIAWTFHPSEERSRELGVEFLSLDDLLQRSDVVSLHLLGSEEVEGMIGERELSLMKPTAFLVNTARGSIVDEVALVEALRSGKIGGAGLDVYETEPLPADHPLRDMENVVLSPHVGAMTPETTLRGLAMAVDNVMSYLDGHPSNVVQA